jgi:pimeloyl-ACP methyl ester carboxylesterase
MKKWLYLLLAASLLLAACNAQPQPAPTATPLPDSAPRFEEADCWFKEPLGYSPECGYLIVPEDHAQPQGKTIKLAVARFTSEADTPQPDPIVYLEGGPGGSPLKSYMTEFPYLFGPLLEKRDLILFDQRGTGYSQPALDCPEYTNLVLDTLDQDLSAEKSEELSNQAMLACRERLVKEGVNLDLYNSAQNAADIEALRQALGYDKLNLYGISYGTRLALTSMRDAAPGLRSVVIDSVYPLQADLYSGIIANGARALEALFAACAADVECNATYPDLRRTFFDLKARLDKEPAQYTITLKSGEKKDAVLNGDNLLGLVFQSMYATSIIPMLPRLITDVRDGNTDLAAGLQAEFLDQYDKISNGMHYAVQCKEEVPFATQAEIDETIKEHADYDALASRRVIDLCKAWIKTPADPIENQPVKSDVPTLVLSGEFDPITPPAWAEETASTLSRSFYINLPRAGHGASITEDCPRDMMLAFLDDPTAKPDSACLAQMAQSKFQIPLRAEDFKLAPFTEKLSTGLSTITLSGVIPEGWKKLSPGAYSPNGKITDSSAIMVQAVPVPPETLLNLLKSQFQSSDLNVEFEKTGTREANGVVWDLYTTSISIADVVMGVGVKDDLTYLILLQAPKSDFTVLRDAVFMPALEALQATP